jgi:hypothetical protein
MYNLYTSTYFHTRTKSIYEEFLIVREFSDTWSNFRITFSSHVIKRSKHVIKFTMQVINMHTYFEEEFS